MPKFKVVLKETLTYNLEVEANTEDEAQDLAFEHSHYTSSISDETDTVVDSVEEIEEEDPNQFEERDHYEV